jgi:hypothetical protein
MYRYVLLLFLFYNPYYLESQVFPKEDSHLNFRIIGFSFPVEMKTGIYTLEIAKGHFNDTALFKKNIIKSIVCTTNREITEVPSFGSDYTWRVTCTHRRKKNISGLHHFSAKMSSRVDTTALRLRILKNAEQYKDAYVFIDVAGVLYDMNGRPVWFLPDIGSKVTVNSLIKDIKVTPQGTLTFMTVALTDNAICEISFDGTLLWKGPNTGEVSGIGNEYYHHEFTRLSNGHYMVIGNQEVLWKLTNYIGDSSVKLNRRQRSDVVRDTGNVYHQKLEFGTIIEYDEKGNVVWSWKSADYFKNSDLAHQIGANGKFEINDPHANSFYFDEQNKIIYISYRNISRILKLKYPEGIVMADYGTKYTAGPQQTTIDMFCGQHCVKRSKDGYLYLFNNNSLTPGNLPKIEILEEPSSETDTLKKVWEYQCTPEDMGDSDRDDFQQFGHAKNMSQKANGSNAELPFSSGGNVTELPGQSIFASLSTPYSGVFIVNKDKKILWRSGFEIYDRRTKNWTGKSMYRASIITDPKDLERLIWNTEMKEQ